MLHVKFGFDWKIKRSLNIMVIYMCIAPGWGLTHAWGPNVFQKLKSSVHLPISSKSCPSNDILTIFPIQRHRRPKLTLP